MFDFEKVFAYENWSPKNHFIASLNYFVFNCIIRSIHEMFQLTNSETNETDIRSYCIHYLSKNKSAFDFCLDIFTHSFVIINQNTLIDSSGNVFPNDDTSYGPDCTQYYKYEERITLPHDDAQSITHMITNAQKYSR